MTDSFSKVAPIREHPSTQIADTNYVGKFDEIAGQGEIALVENIFHSMLTLERRRAERSRKPFVLMLLDANLENGSAAGILKEAAEIMVASKRETDLIGWYKESAILGAIFTEVNIEGERPVTETLRAKFETALAKHLGREKAAKIAISMHIFPESWDKNHSGWIADSGHQRPG